MEGVFGLLQPFAHGRGFPTWQPITQPAAGATASYVVPGGWYLRVLAARLTITTDANVADRLVSLDYIDSNGRTWLRNGASVLVTASTTAQAFEFQSNLNFANWDEGTPVFCPVAPFFLPPSFVVKFNVTGIQTTDQISGLGLWFEQFATGPQGYATGYQNPGANV